MSSVRSAVLAAIVLVGTSALAACGDDGPRAATRPPGSTLERTLVDRTRSGVLDVGPGEPLLERTELAPAAPVARTLVTLVQLSDVQVTDEESPLRVEVADRLGGTVASAFRPQESLTAQVFAAALQSANAVKPDWLLVTGDLVDNAQTNELSWALDELAGRRVVPDSGRPGYDGLQEAASADPLIYRPDLDSPRHPGLLAAAQKAVDSRGSAAPWLPAISNHDVLVQGVLPVDPGLAAIATGTDKLTRVDPAVLDPVREGRLDPVAAEQLVLRGAGAAYRQVPADAGRLPLLPADAVARVAAAAGVSTMDGLLAYDRELAPGVWLVTLDTAVRSGGAGGVLPDSELAWLERTLAAHRGAHILVVSPTPLEDTAGGDAALALLDRTPGVVAVLAGDTHRARIRPRPAPGGGYWLVRAPSLVDYPQQGRALRLVELADGRLALETWMIDHAGDRTAPGFLGLAGISRDLAYLDLQGGRPQGWLGQPSDRNARLYLPAPTGG